MNAIRTTVLLLTLLASLCFGKLPEAAAQSKRDFPHAVPSIKAKFEPTTARRGQTVTWKLMLEIAPGWHTYPTYQRDPNASAMRNKFTFPKREDLVWVGELKEPKTQNHPGISLGQQLLVIEAGTVTWERSAVVLPNAQPGEKVIQVPVTILVCDEYSCLRPEALEIEARLTVSDEEPVPVESQYADQVQQGVSPK